MEDLRRPKKKTIDTIEERDEWILLCRRICIWFELEVWDAETRRWWITWAWKKKTYDSS